MDNRSLSNALGFFLVFSLIIMSIASVSVFGLESLNDARNAEQLTNTERAFDVLAHNQEDIFLRGAPSRATEIKLSGGALRMTGTTTVRIQNDTGAGPTYEAETRPIVYDFEDSEIVYENGALIRTDRNAGVMVRGPPGNYDSNEMILHVVNVTQGDTTTSVGGEQTRLVRTQSVNTTIHENENNPDDFTLEIETTEARAKAWQRHLDEEFSTSCTRSAGTVTCTPVSSDRLLIIEHELEADFE